MIKYSLSDLIKKKGRAGNRPALVPVIEVPAAFERSLLAQLRRVGQEVARGIREIIMPAYERKLATKDSGLVQDADEASMDGVRLIVGAMVRAASDQVKGLLALEGLRHTKQFMTSARRAFGIDLSSVIGEEDLGDYLDAAALRNASLIRGMSDDILKRVAQETSTALIAGESAKSLQARLKKQLEISDSRARLIARDQSGKLTADLNSIRQQQAGIESYIWRTSQDERVRPRHVALQNKVYKWGEPTGAEDGLPPGQPIQCRCTAQGVVDFGADAPAKPSPAPSVSPFDLGKESADGHLSLAAPSATYRRLPGLTDVDKQNVTNYQGLGYKSVNQYLRGDKSALERNPYLWDSIDALDKGIGASAPLGEGFLYRGLAVSPDQLAKMRKGFQHDNFLSTSSKFQSAEFFGSTQESIWSDGHVPVVLRIKTSGQKALYMDAVEHEYVLPRGSKFKVLREDEFQRENSKLKVKVLTVEVDG